MQHSKYKLDWCRGKFITFEGGEGVGKTTNLKFVAASLETAKIPYIVTREPGGTAIGEKLRAILLQPTSEQILPITELLLVFAARSQHINHVILPALKNDLCVLCDRFTDASYAYQGGGRKIDKTYIKFLQQMVQQDLHPNLTILLDAPVTIGLERAKGRAKLDRIESEQVSFFERIRTAYLEQASNSDHEYYIINANDSLTNIQTKIMQLLSR